ncbi:MAG: hypothetical protein V4603_15655 [Pseudomonadota bacterium]
MKVTRELLLPWIPIVLVLVQMLVETPQSRNYPSLVVFFFIGYTQFLLFRTMNDLKKNSSAPTP